ncbi:MAG: hypothetical protein ACYCTI_02795 [Acidimicrobiales bacterium]
MKAVLDAGALIAIDRRDRRVGAMLRVLQQDGTPVFTSAGALAQVWRDGRRQANLARVLPGVDTRAIDTDAAKKVGELLRASSTEDIVDAHVAVMTDAGDQILTSDGGDLTSLLRTLRVKAAVVAV